MCVKKTTKMLIEKENVVGDSYYSIHVGAVRDETE